MKTLIEQMQQKLHHSEEQQSSLESMYTEAKLSLERSIMEQSSDNSILKKEVDRLHDLVSELKRTNKTLEYKNDQQLIHVKECEQSLVRIKEKLQLSKSQRANDRADFELKLRKDREITRCPHSQKCGNNSGSSKKNIQLDKEEQQAAAQQCTYLESKYEQEVKIMKKEIADLQKLRRKETDQKDEDIEKMKSALDELQKTHESELSEREILYKSEHNEMYERMEELRNEIIATRQTMITEMNQKVEAERLRLNLDHENIIHGLKMSYQEKILDFQSKERKWKIEKTKLEHKISTAKQHAQRITESAAREELVFKSRTKALNEKLKTLSGRKDSDKQIKEFLDTASAKLAHLSKSQLGYEASQDRLREELEEQHVQTLHALHSAEAKLTLKTADDKNESRASDNFDIHKSPVYIALKQNYDKVIAESKIP